jgi:hypothetical protein
MPPAVTTNAPVSGPRTPWRLTDVPGRVRADPCCQGEEDEGEPGGERPHAEDVLQVERAEQEEAEDRAGRREHEEDAAADGAIG